MTLSVKQKKWLKAGGIVFASLLTITLVLYYSIAFRLRETLQFIVHKESKGIYAFNASHIEVSLVHRQVSIKNASLGCKDTAETTPHYDVKIPDIFLSIQSIRELLFARKLMVDSLSIAMPVVKIHEHVKKEPKHIGFHASKIFEVLQRLKMHLKIKSFSIHKASFDYGNIHNPNPFKSDRISLVVKNFSDDNNPDQRFLSSEEVDLSILNQHWKLPDGLHEISFTKLHFSGSNQFFEIDSCLFKGKDKENHAYSISAEKLFFNSTQLSDFYNKEELILDTLLLYKPVMHLETSKKEKKNDSSGMVSHSFRQLFKVINFRYVDITAGNIQITEKNTDRRVFASNGTNFKIYNLLLNRDSAAIEVDNISLQQKNISFVTKDSLFKLSIGEFSIENNAVFLTNAVYEPTEKNGSSKIFSFTSPLLKLTNINLEALLEKRLTAATAELHQPRIIFKTAKAKKRERSHQNDDKFYTTLHGLSELVHVQEFRILNGSLHFQSGGPASLDVRMEKINSLVLLDSLFSSDSLIDVKRSLPLVAIGKVHLQSPKVKLHVADYIFKGQVRHNSAASFHLELPHGTALKGKKLSWVIFDWDRYRNYKEIQVNTLHIRELAVLTHPKQAIAGEHVNKHLPFIHIDRIDVDKIDFEQGGAKQQLSFNGEQLCMDNLTSSKNAFTWGNAEGVFKNIVINKEGLKAKLPKVYLNTQAQTSVHDAVVEMVNTTSRTHILIPALYTNLQLHSSDVSAIDIPVVTVKQPVVHFTQLRSKDTTFTSKPNRASKTAFSIGNLHVEKADFQFKHLSNSDAVSLNTVVDLQVQNIHQRRSKKEALTWQQLAVQLSETTLDKQGLQLRFPVSKMAFSNGRMSRNDEKLVFQSNLSGTWKDADLCFSKLDSTCIVAETVSGSIANHQFSFEPAKKFQWHPLLPHLSVNSAQLKYKNKKSTITARDVDYKGSDSSLNILAFSLTPHTNAATLFKNTGWQTDHTSLQTGKLQIKGIQWQHALRDSVWRARHVLINDPKLTTIKDKRYPFRHGIEKPMLAYMINKIKLPLDIDSVQLRNGSIYIHEITEKTHKEAIVPLEKVNAIATNVRNRNNQDDSLQLDASLQLYSTKMHYFQYRESYGDTLSSFTLRVGLSPVAFTELSQLTLPFANVHVTGGRADTVFASWTGNKYAAVGKMNFIYNGLKIKIMSAKDTSRTTVLGRMESFVANDLALHKKNKQPAIIFFVRDREKSVFNYWIKTKLNGVIASAVILQRKKHYREYMRYKEKYYLRQLE